MKTLVVGGTGHVGSMVVKELVKRRTEVRVLARRATATVPAGVEVAVGDLLDPASVEKAMEGVDKLYLLNAVTPDELTQGLIAYDIAKRLRVKHVVYHSVFRAEQFLDVPHVASKFAIESALRRFDVPFTILRPNYFFQNDASMKGVIANAGIYPVPLGPVGVSAIDVRDVAEAAAITLTSEGHAGKSYNLNGPEVLSGTKVAAIWRGLLKTSVHYSGENMDAFEAQMKEGSAPGWSAFDIRMMFQGYLERGFAAGAGDIESVTALLGHAPRRYVDFARETVAAWRKDTSTSFAQVAR
jgi:uncharacterized protein YbjT (DUF2867 family)